MLYYDGWVCVRLLHLVVQAQAREAELGEIELRFFAGSVTAVELGRVG